MICLQPGEKKKPKAKRKRCGEPPLWPANQLAVQLAQQLRSDFLTDCARHRNQKQLAARGDSCATGGTTTLLAV